MDFRSYPIYLTTSELASPLEIFFWNFDLRRHDKCIWLTRCSFVMLNYLSLKIFFKKRHLFLYALPGHETTYRWKFLSILIFYLFWQAKVTGLREAVRVVYRIGGTFGFFRGLRARVVYQIPSTAICWSTYEFLKYALTNTITQLPDHPILPGDKQSDDVSISVQRSPLIEPSLSSRSSSAKAAKTCELPISSSHHGVYNAFTLSSVHTTDNVTTNPIIDVRHSEMILKWLYFFPVFR